MAWKWFFSTVIAGLSPFFIRVIVCVVLINRRSLQILDPLDFNNLVLVVSVSMYSIKDKLLLPTGKREGLKNLSIFGIFLSGGLTVLSYILIEMPEKVNEGSMLFLSILAAFAYIVATTAAWNRLEKQEARQEIAR